jgi:hypothetical protein
MTCAQPYKVPGYFSESLVLTSVRWEVTRVLCRRIWTRFVLWIWSFWFGKMSPVPRTVVRTPL